MELQQLLSLLLVFSCNSETSEINTGTDHYYSGLPQNQNILKELLQAINFSREISGRVCSLKFFEQVPRTNLSDFTIFDKLLDWSIFGQEQFEIYEPYERFTKIDNFDLPSRRKHGSSCVTYIIIISDSLVSHGEIMSIKIGDPVYDIYIFVSTNETHLQSLLSSNDILNGVVSKHGVHIISSGCLVSLSYLIEPPSFTGSFIRSKFPGFLQGLEIIRGRSLRVAYPNLKPIFFVSGPNMPFDGTYNNILIECSRRHNFTLNFYGRPVVPGVHLKNGSWTGMVGELIAERADLTPVLAATPERYPLVGFSYPLHREGLIFAVKLPDNLLQWKALILPLSKIVWICTLSMFVLFTFFLYFTFYVLNKNNQELDIVKHLKIFSSAVSMPYEILLEQPSTSIISSKLTIRLITMLWIFLALQIGVAYKSNLVGYLTFPEKQVIPTTFHELNHHPEYSILLHSIGGLELEHLRNSPSPDIQGIVKRMTILNSAKPCIKAVAEQHLTACVAWKNAILTEMGLYKPPFLKRELLYISTEFASYADISFGMRKRSIYSAELNHFSGMFAANGLVYKWNELFVGEIQRKMVHEGKLRKHEETRDVDDGEAKPLKLINLLAVYAAWFLGCALACSGFIVEFLWHSFNKKLCFRRNKNVFF